MNFKINVTLKKIVETKTENEDGDSMNYTAQFQSKDEDSNLKVSISQDEAFDLAIGEEYAITITTEQTKLAKQKYGLKPDPHQVEIQ